LIKPKGRTAIELDENIGLLLGYGGKTELQGLCRSPVPINLHYRTNTIYVHFSIVAPSIVGDTYNRILRVIPIHSMGKNMLYKAFTAKQYHHLDTDRVTSITIRLLTERGELLPLLGSATSTWLTLEFEQQ